MLIAMIVVIFIINVSFDLIAGKEAPHTIAEGLNMLCNFHSDSSDLNDSHISFSQLYLSLLCFLNNNC